MATKAGRITAAEIRAGRTIFFPRINFLVSTASGYETYYVERLRVIKKLTPTKKYKGSPAGLSHTFLTLAENGEERPIAFTRDMELRLGKGPIPTNFFTSHAKAVAWIRRYSANPAHARFEHPAYNEYAHKLLIEHCDHVAHPPVYYAAIYGTPFVMSYLAKCTSGWPTQSIEKEYAGRAGATVYWGDLNQKAAAVNADADQYERDRRAAGQAPLRKLAEDKN